MAEKKLPKGVYLRKDGRYEGRFMYHGEKYSVYGEDARKVKKQLDDLRYEVQHNMYDKPSNITVDKWFNEWIEVYKKPNVKNGTVATKLKYYRLYIQKPLGKKYMVDVMGKDIQKIYNNMAADGYSTSTINGVCALLSEMFEQAYKGKIIKENPARFTTRPRGVPKKSHPALTKQEQELFVKYAKEHAGPYYIVFMLALCTGMRMGEVRALRWQDVDFQKKVIHITGTLTRSLSENTYRDTPKTLSSVRDIPMMDNIFELLKQQKREQLQMKLKAGWRWQPLDGLSDLVFLTEYGKPIAQRTVDRYRDITIEHIRADGHKIKDFVFHSFRHTFATRAIEGGMNPQTLKTILGHSDIATTLNTYAHVMDNTKIEEMKLISELF